MKLKEKIYKKINDFQHVSFAELMQSEGWKGDMAIWLSNYPNILYWQKRSKGAIDAIEDLWLKENKIEARVGSAFVYWHDGASLNLPIAKRPPKKDYKKTHWRPITFSTPEYLKRIEGKRYKINTTIPLQNNKKVK